MNGRMKRWKKYWFERMIPLDLTKNTPENIEFILSKITEKLKMINISAVNSSHINEELYEELRDIYEMVMKKTSFSPNEMQAIVEELGKLRK